MDVRVNQFAVKHNGKIYGPGSVMYGLDDEDGKKLVEESNGELEELPPDTTKEETKPDNGSEDNGAGGITLPDVDPKKTVDPGTKK